MAEKRIIEKIKKLLALSENNPSSEEAFAAMLKAQKMLLENGLSSADIDINETKKGVVEETMGMDTLNLPSWKHPLIYVICKNFRVSPFKARTFSGAKRKTVVMLVGLKEDVDVCKEILEYCFSAFQSLSRAYLKQRKRESFYIDQAILAGIKNDYLEGFCKGLDKKFKKQVSETSLMLVQDEAVMEYVKTMSTAKARKRNLTTAGDTDARSQGYSDAVTLSKHKVIV